MYSPATRIYPLRPYGLYRRQGVKYIATCKITLPTHTVAFSYFYFSKIKNVSQQKKMYSFALQYKKTGDAQGLSGCSFFPTRALRFQPGDLLHKITLSKGASCNHTHYKSQAACTKKPGDRHKESTRFLKNIFIQRNGGKLARDGGVLL